MRAFLRVSALCSLQLFEGNADDCGLRGFRFMRTEYGPLRERPGLWPSLSGLAHRGRIARSVRGTGVIARAGRGAAARAGWVRSNAEGIERRGKAGSVFGTDQG